MKTPFLLAYNLRGDTILVRREHARQLAYFNNVKFREPNLTELFVNWFWRPIVDNKKQ